MSGLLDKINAGYVDIITDNDIIEIAESIFDMEISNKEDKTIEFETHFGTIHINKKEYEINKKFFEEREISAIKELSKYVTT